MIACESYRLSVFIPPLMMKLTEIIKKQKNVYNSFSRFEAGSSKSYTYFNISMGFMYKKHGSCGLFLLVFVLKFIFPFHGRLGIIHVLTKIFNPCIISAALLYINWRFS